MWRQSCVTVTDQVSLSSSCWFRSMRELKGWTKKPKKKKHCEGVEELMLRTWSWKRKKKKRNRSRWGDWWLQLIGGRVDVERIGGFLFGGRRRRRSSGFLLMTFGPPLTHRSAAPLPYLPSFLTPCPDAEKAMILVFSARQLFHFSPALCIMFLVEVRGGSFSCSRPVTALCCRLQQQWAAAFVWPHICDSSQPASLEGRLISQLCFHVRSFELKWEKWPWAVSLSLALSLT